MTVYKSAVRNVKLVTLTRAQFVEQSGHKKKPRGKAFLLPEDVVKPFEGMEVVDGYAVSPYEGAYAGRRDDYCGLSDARVAYVVSRDTTDAIVDADYERSVERDAAYERRFQRVHKAVAARVDQIYSGDTNLEDWLREGDWHRLSVSEIVAEWEEYCQPYCE